MSIRRSNQLSYNPKKRKVNKGSGLPAGKPSMHVTEIGRRTVFEGLGDHFPQALGRKGVIRQAGQRQPFEADLPAIALPALPNRGKVLTETMEDCLNLMKVTVDPMHGVVLADVFAKIEETLRYDFQAEFLQDFTAHGVTQCLSMILAAARQHEELALFRADADREDVAVAKDDGTSRRPDPRGSTTGLATRSGHEATLPRRARQ